MKVSNARQAPAKLPCRKPRAAGTSRVLPPQLHAGPVAHFGRSLQGESASKVQNQDALLLCPGLGGTALSLFGVCDGHGPYGHEIAQIAAAAFPEALTQVLGPQLPAALQQAVRQVNKRVLDLPTSCFSGSTLVSALVTPTAVLCANVGDSRALLASKLHGCWRSTPLNTLHQPGQIEEARRIELFGGELRGSPVRVWLPGQNVPGLAMSRSLGDQRLKEHGVSAVADVTVHTLTDEDCFLVLGSDGLWEVLSDEEVVETVRKHWELGYAKAACNALLAEARRRWQGSAHVDDITAVVVFLKFS